MDEKVAAGSGEGSSAVDMGMYPKTRSGVPLSESVDLMRVEDEELML